MFWIFGRFRCGCVRYCLWLAGQDLAGARKGRIGIISYDTIPVLCAPFRCDSDHARICSAMSARRIFSFLRCIPVFCWFLPGRQADGRSGGEAMGGIYIVERAKWQMKRKIFLVSWMVLMKFCAGKGGVFRICVLVAILPVLLQSSVRLCCRIRNLGTSPCQRTLGGY